ncbi:MAG TPA: M13 family metallopeptidase [Steroidobacteraceae bacterium]|nr:M13 family metallopeptidase [Steroidobacteraceae bacterium]
MGRLLNAFSIMTLIATAANAAELPSAALISAHRAGIDVAGMDHSVRPQDDFYAHVNGGWLAHATIPPDKPEYSMLSALSDRTLEQLHGIVDQAARSTSAAPGSEMRKVGDLYASFMNERAIEAAGLKPLQAELARIDALKSKAELPELIAHLSRIDVETPYDIGVGPDARDSTKYAVGIDQSGLGLPDRDYYLRDDDARLKAARAKYEAHIARMLELAGSSGPQAAREAADILALETAIARAQWTKVELRDPVKTYNKVPFTKLPGVMPGWGWSGYLEAAGVAHTVDYVIVGEPSYFEALDGIVRDTPLPVWKSYFRWHLLSTFAPLLPRAFVDESFAFRGGVLRGTPQNQPRWKRGVHLVDGAIGEGLGKLYVAKYFPPQSKVRMQVLVGNLLAAYRHEIDELDWMGPQTKKEAQAKLARMQTKIGYPNKWRDYSTLSIDREDLIGNVMRASEFEYHRQISKLGKPIDRDEWEMTPQTINAYYRPDLNEIVFPAAILQPPLFNPQADDAANYGAIGAIIGHEMSHGFDDQGSQFDSTGNLRDWWTKADHERFAAKTAALVAQYDAAEPLKGYHVNGKLTLGENIADNSGLAISYKAYRIALNGAPAPVIAGFTGDQRFYVAFSQAWRGKVRDEMLVLLLKADPHSPTNVRGLLPLKNQPAFYNAFDVKAGDGMYLPPEKRVIIW